jgi:glycosyltransferase A (GT-A) superfamily protein (DUF2064 family)
VSLRDIGRHQLKRLVDAGLRVGMLPELTDVDTIENAFDVAAIAPDGEFARTLERFQVTEGSLV